MLILRHLAGNSFELKNISDADDSQNLLSNLEKLQKNLFPLTLDVGHAGTNMRFLTALLAQTEGEYILKGSPRMHQRPVKILVDALNHLGAKIEYLETNGYPPLRISGQNLRGGKLSIPAGVSSQYISALMMTAPNMKQGLHLEFSSPVVSYPYLEMTQQLMEALEMEVHLSPDYVRIPRQNISRTLPFHIESDWSAASYWYAMAVLVPEIKMTLQGLKNNSFQGDRRVANMFQDFGIDSVFHENGVTLQKQWQPLPDNLQPDLTETPDLAQTIIVLAALLGIEGRFTGLQTLAIKETNRLAALQQELKKFGIIAQITSNQLVLPKQPLHPPQDSIATYNDHRMAMAFAPAAILFGHLKIQHPAVTGKSYPAFWNHLRQAGFDLTYKSES
jgi:3-phosphoshikimate 1-carboxyvinyltransferase